MLFYASFVLMGLGVYLMIKMMMKKYPKLVKKLEDDSNKSGRISMNAVAMITLIKNFPAIVVFILFCIPTLYVSSLLQKYNYCVEIFKANKSVGITKDDEFVQERCKSLNLDEVMNEAYKND